MLSLPIHSSASCGERGTSAFVGREGRPLSDDEIAAAWVQSLGLPLPALHLVGSASSDIAS